MLRAPHPCGKYPGGFVKPLRSVRRAFGISVVLTGVLFGGAVSGILGLCGPFTDVSDASFCPFVLEIFTLGITTGTTPTTYDPTASVSRLQMAAFLSRTVDGVSKRGGPRATLNQFWTTEANASLALTTVGSGPAHVVSDGEDLWVANNNGNSVSRVHGSDGKLLETWTGATAAFGVLVAMGRVFATANSSNGMLFRIDPSQAAGAVTTVTSNLGNFPTGIAFDGSRIWTASQSGSVSIVTPGATLPWTVTTVTTGVSNPFGALYDGANVWVTDLTGASLLKLDSGGTILQTVPVGDSPQFPVFDGANIWVPNGNSNSVSVVRASNGAVLTTLTGNGLSVPGVAAFDGQRVLVTNEIGNRVSLWKSADLTPLGSFGTGSTSPFGACSDGVYFWITLGAVGQLVRF
jgi:hypothetical protein